MCLLSSVSAQDCIVVGTEATKNVTLARALFTPGFGPGSSGRLSPPFCYRPKTRPINQARCDEPSDVDSSGKPVHISSKPTSNAEAPTKKNHHLQPLEVVVVVEETNRL